MAGEADVLVVGARVAGCVAAIRLAEQGHRVMVVDRSMLPSSTVSTHFFRGEGLVGVLDQLGLLPATLALGAPPLRRQWMSVNGAEPVEGGPQLPGAIGYCLSVRRQPLDALLVERARAAGAEVRPCTRLVGLERYREGWLAELDGEGGARQLRCRLLVGADGRGSFVARAVGAAEEEREEGHRALYYTYVEGWTSPGGDPQLDAAEFSLCGDEVAYVFPSDAGMTCIAVSVNRATFRWMRSDLERRFRERLAAHRHLAARFAAVDTGQRVLGAGPARNVVRTAAGPGWALAGDAGQHQDPWTGVGMDLAARQAWVLADQYGSWLEGRTSEADAAGGYCQARDALGRETWRSTVRGSRDLAAAGS